MMADITDLVLGRIKQLLIFFPEIQGVKKDEAHQHDLIFETAKGDVGVHLSEQEGQIFFKFDSGDTLSIARMDLFGKPS